MDLEKLKQLAYELLGEKSSHEWKEKGNKFHHGQRVAALAIDLRHRLFPDDSLKDGVLTVAAWFHDLRNGCEEQEAHALLGAQAASELLRGLCTQDEVDEICSIIAVHDDRHPEGSPYNDLIKLHQDADLLDHMGTFDIWSNCLYSVSHGQSFLEMVDSFRQALPTEYPRLREELNFELSHQIFDEKLEYIKAFMDRVAVEGAGGIWNPPDNNPL